MAEPSEGTLQTMRESRVATTTLGEAPEVVKQEMKETKKKKKKVQEEAVALNKDDPLPGYENVENNGQCEGCVGDSIPCAVEIDKLIAWRTGDSGVKAVCWQCKCKRKACDFGGDGSGAKGKAKEKTWAMSPVPSTISSLKRKWGAQVVVELPKTKKAKTGESEVAEWGRKIERKLDGDFAGGESRDWWSRRNATGLSMPGWRACRGRHPRRSYKGRAETWLRS
jgi:hypothetical protein